MTSAPKSAMMVVDTGPAMKLAASITRIPSRRRVMVRAPPVGRPVTRGKDGMRPGKEYRDSLFGGRRDWILREAPSYHSRPRYPRHSRVRGWDAWSVQNLRETQIGRASCRERV